MKAARRVPQSEAKEQTREEETEALPVEAAKSAPVSEGHERAAGADDGGESGLEQQYAVHGATESGRSEELRESLQAEAVPPAPEPGGTRTDDQPIARKERERMAEENEAARQDTESAASAPAAEVPVTEQPVGSKPVPVTTQYVITVDNETGIATKVERIDEETADRREISADEYAAMYSYSAGMSSPELASFMSFSAPGASFGYDPLREAYYRGVADYLQALTRLG